MQMKFRLSTTLEGLDLLFAGGPGAALALYDSNRIDKTMIFFAYE